MLIARNVLAFAGRFGGSGGVFPIQSVGLFVRASGPWGLVHSGCYLGVGGLEAETLKPVRHGYIENSFRAQCRVRVSRARFLKP